MERERPPPLNKEKARPWSQVAAAVSSLQILFSVVHEVTDNMELPIEEIKRLQVVSAPEKSKTAKLFALSDRLWNLRHLQQCTPK